MAETTMTNQGAAVDMSDEEEDEDDDDDKEAQ